MYNFVYDFCFKTWGTNNFEICMTDTDSLLALIDTNYFYKHATPYVDTILIQASILMSLEC